MKVFAIFVTSFLAFSLGAQPPRDNNPGNALSVLKLIGDKLIRDTPFQYRLSVARKGKTFKDLNFIDLGRTFGTHSPAVAYAYTELTCAEDQDLTIELGHPGTCAIWVNKEKVYEKANPQTLDIRFEERSVELPEHFTVRLKRGRNRVVIEARTGGGEWVVYLQPPSLKGAVVSGPVKNPEIGLRFLPVVNKDVAELSNWLVIGPFPREEAIPVKDFFSTDDELMIGKMYQGINEKITWTIPKVEVVGKSIDPLPWGTNYDWNYHNGGVAWAMQKLAEVSGEEKYNKYASDFCDFHIEGAPFVNYQVKTLREVYSANSAFLFSPLLDFTLAPSLPFVYRLRTDKEFANRDDYEAHVDRMIDYARNKQVRLPGKEIYTRLTPEQYTTWVDDMFMGIPFLVQVAQLRKGEAEGKTFLDDAAKQVLGFNEVVWDREANLYSHAKYSQRDVTLPHWSRANGWGVWATTEVLMHLPRNHKAYKTILKHYRTHVDALVRLQNERGFWNNVLDRPDSRDEVSGTAIFTMAIARGIRHGWLDDRYGKFADKGWNAIKSQIDPDGTVHNICCGTMCSEDVNYYLNQPFYDNDTHGLFAVLFAGIEMHLMSQKRENGTGK